MRARAARSDGGSFASPGRRPACVRLVELVHAESEVPILPDGTRPLEAA